MATLSSILAWRILSQESDTTVTNIHFEVIG